MDKAFILSEIKRTAAENGGKPLGRDAFRKEAGVNDYDWSLYWNRFSDAQREAGCDPNTFDNAYAHEDLIKKLIELIQKLGRFPIRAEMQRETRLIPSFPSDSTFFRQLGGKAKMASRVVEYCQGKTGLDDVGKICLPFISEEKIEVKEVVRTSGEAGYVYLWKSHRRYKIGKSFDLERRKSELAAQSPYEWKRIHEIKTDDPSGVEAYWHRRFADKKTERNEWFELTSDDVKAFKRWRNIF